MKAAQSCLTLCDPMDCSPPGTSVHGILKARILEWVAMPFSKGSSWPGDQTCVSYISCIGRRTLCCERRMGNPIIGEMAENRQKGKDSWEMDMRKKWGWLRMKAPWRTQARVRKEALHPEMMAQEAPILPVRWASIVTEPDTAVGEAQQWAGGTPGE